MQKAVRGLLGFVEGKTYQDVLDNEGLRLIVERELEIIGEAASKISPAFREAHPEIAWRSIIGLRNVIVHAYGDIDYERLWQIVINQIPELQALLQNLVKDIRSE